MKAKNTLFQRGFTLIELLVVISIIGILSALLLPNLTSAQARARDGRRKSDLKSIATGLELFYNDNNYYPLPWSSGATAGKFTFTAALTDAGGTTTYIKAPVPKDPKNTVNAYEYYYCTVSATTAASNKKFSLLATLENANDPDKCSAAGCSGSITATACTAGSNSGAYSSNSSKPNYFVNEP